LGQKKTQGGKGLNQTLRGAKTLARMGTRREIQPESFSRAIEQGFGLGKGGCVNGGPRSGLKET